MRNVIVMFVTAVCFLFLLKLKWPKNKNIYDALSTYLEYMNGRHVARLRRRRAYSPTSNAASHDNHEKINSWVSFSFLYEYGAPLVTKTA